MPPSGKGGHPGMLARAVAPVATYCAQGSTVTPYAHRMLLPQVQYTYFTSQHIRPRWFGAGLQGRVFEECMALARGYYTWMAFTDLVGAGHCACSCSKTKFRSATARLLKRVEKCVCACSQTTATGMLCVQRPPMESVMRATFTSMQLHDGMTSRHGVIGSLVPSTP